MKAGLFGKGRLKWELNLVFVVTCGVVKLRICLVYFFSF